MKQLLIVTAQAAAAAKVIVQDHMEVMTFQVAKPETLKDRIVLLWPAAPGIDPKKAEALTIQAERAKTLSLFDKPKGWSAIQALAEGMRWDQFREWVPTKAIPILSLSPDVAQELGITVGDDPKPTAAQKRLVDEVGMAVNGTGNPYCNAANVVRFLERTEEYAKHIWTDDFLQTMMTDVRGQPEEWTDRASNELMVHLQSHFAMHNLTSKHVEQAIAFYAEGDHRHQVRDWMSKLTWDRTSRIGDFFITYMGATTTPAMVAFGTNFWISIVKRIFNPGCQADYMVVLEGGQGIGKTRAMQIIGGDYYAEVGVTADSTDFERQLQGKMLVEISELHSFSKADQSRIKQIITKRDDHWVPKYKEHSVKHPRQCVLVGTTNESEWIKDQTGGRRFWPVRCGTIDLVALERDRDQLFAEAVVALMEGEQGFIVPQEETIQLQDERREHDAWEEVLRDKLQLLPRVTAVEAMKLLGIPEERMDGRAHKRVSYVLRRLGFITKSFKISGESKRSWFRDEGVTCHQDVTQI